MYAKNIEHELAHYKKINNKQQILHLIQKFDTSNRFIIILDSECPNRTSTCNLQSCFKNKTCMK